MLSGIACYYYECDAEVKVRVSIFHRSFSMSSLLQYNPTMGRSRLDNLLANFKVVRYAE